MLGANGRKTGHQQTRTFWIISSKKIKKEIQKIKNETIETYLTKLTADKSTDYDLWKAVKKFKRPKLQSLLIRKRDGVWARNNKQKANTFAEYLENVFQPNTQQDEEDTEIERSSE